VVRWREELPFGKVECHGWLVVSEDREDVSSQKQKWVSHAAYIMIIS
jgi:hypothetical protein